MGFEFGATGLPSISVTQNSNLHSIELRTWSTKFYSYAGDREVRVDHWTGIGRGRRNPLAIFSFVRLGWQTPRRYLSPERKLLVLLSSRHLHSYQCRSHAFKLVVQAVIWIDHKSSEICDRRSLWQQNSPATPENSTAFRPIPVEFLPAKL